MAGTGKRRSARTDAAKASNKNPTGTRDDKGRFMPGNRFWEARSSAGPNPKFADPEALWAACCEYFAWNHANPLKEAKAFAYEGNVTLAELPKMRAMTIGGLCMFLDVSRSTWDEWRKSRPDLSDIITRAEAVIFRQKFEGASADLLNANIIARDLGLADKKELTGANGGPIQTEEIARDADAFASRMARLAAAAVQSGDGKPNT